MSTAPLLGHLAHGTQLQVDDLLSCFTRAHALDGLEYCQVVSAGGASHCRVIAQRSGAFGSGESANIMDAMSRALEDLTEAERIPPLPGPSAYGASPAA